MAPVLGSSIICREKYWPDAREKREDIAIIDVPKEMQNDSSWRIDSWNIHILYFLLNKGTMNLEIKKWIHPVAYSVSNYCAQNVLIIVVFFWFEWIRIHQQQRENQAKREESEFDGFLNQSLLLMEESFLSSDSLLSIFSPLSSSAFW